MSKNYIIILLLLVVGISGCANILSSSPQERIAQHQARCEAMGFKKQTVDLSYCVLELEKANSHGKNYSRKSVEPTNDARIQRMIDNDRMRRQILNHGAGGCTPNFATGGCL